jgi:S-adenosylmethionine-diacylglycerol 3-amino-3-carboxypropyl transferase
VGHGGIFGGHLRGRHLKGIEARADFDFVRYGTVWEDAGILCQALRGVAAGGRLLSVASAGGNALALLTLDPQEVVAVDLNPAQLACLEIRLAAFQALDYQGLLGFLGVNADPRRQATYASLRGRLSPGARAFWDAKPEDIQRGVLHAGKLERFLRLYQWCLRRLVHSPERVAQMLDSRGSAERINFYEGVWDTRAWRLLNRLAFSRRVLGRLGRDPEFFRHAEADVSSGPRERLKRAMTELEPHSNPYLTYHLTGNYSAAALPLFLRPENFGVIQSRSGRMRLLLGRAEDAPGEFSGFNLSNIFEYMGPEEHVAAYQRLLGHAKPGARLAYWNLHVDRSCPASARGRVEPLDAMAQGLHEADQSWAYRSFHVDQVLGA